MQDLGLCVQFRVLGSEFRIHGYGLRAGDSSVLKNHR